jgi:hypothetical protein
MDLFLNGFSRQRASLKFFLTTQDYKQNMPNTGACNLQKTAHGSSPQIDATKRNRSSGKKLLIRQFYFFFTSLAGTMTTPFRNI